MVALLRGVNVGGTGQLAMADLRRFAAELGYADVSTYIQSGNLVLSTSVTSASVAADLAAAIAASTSAKPAVLVRTRRQLARAVAVNPFTARGEDPAHLHVLFTDGAASSALRPLDLPSYEPEEAEAIGSEVFLLLPGGVGRSRLATDIGRGTGINGTMRNWRTVTKLLDMAEQIEV
jgi:uncharacterized protein (DUF1697 family)